MKKQCVGKTQVSKEEEFMFVICKYECALGIYCLYRSLMAY
jgi:hypothetical protein